ncbi:SDR family oxidoreductase [Pedobacter sp. BS3]|uniref:SDR family oxidoreductase n=1 Tax=Pedobacter sp. BS3 TaxID=2567937 RepID=UPI0011EE7C14|nr:SDR family oxidoreductase [Pedobacter sp. BS3]TZF85063.1 SDR family oxidoreductase [Pedobacter sp. BS3]
MENLNNRVILVTGGAQGLGKAICTTLAAAGATIVIGDIQENKAQEVTEAINRDNGQASFIRLDLGDENNVEQVINGIKNQFGKLDVLINNAGIDFTKSIMELSVSEWDSAMKVNLRGPFLTSKYTLPVMAEQGGGHIINIISTASLRAWSEASVYHASKWGLRGFTQALFTEARRYNVKVTGLIAGGMKTPFLLDRFPDIDQSKLQEPENVANKIRYILQDDTDTVVPEIMVLPLQETSWP